MSRTVHPPYDTETMLRVLRDDRELPRTTRVEFRGITMNGIKTVADLLSKFRLAGQFRLKVDKDADPRFSLVRVELVAARRSHDGESAPPADDATSRTSV